MTPLEKAVAHTLRLEGGFVNDPGRSRRGDELGDDDRGAHYADIDVDGGVGDQTLGALRAFGSRRGQEGLDVLVAGLNCLQGARYVTIAEGRAESEKFIYG
ncbi:MAG: hypothetical protein IH849_10775 [Acidobacteria bacterium]|nr:hypothetical protein [Acidobacteriota bacterium]